MPNILKAYLAKQLSFPSGWFGKVLLGVLNRSNAKMNEVTASALELQPQQHLLEIGFGGGDLIERCFQLEPTLQITGLDPAIATINFASKRFPSQVQTGQLKLIEGYGENLDFAAATFAHIVSVNNLYFWSKPRQVIGHCHRLLQQNGQLVITYNSKRFLEKSGAIAHGFRGYEPVEVEMMLQEVGFQAIQTITETSPYDGEFFCSSGQKR